MALITLQTRLVYVLTAANTLRDECVFVISQLAFPVKLGWLRRLADKYQNLIDTVCIPYAADTALSDYADAQFNLSFTLSARISGMQYLLQQTVDEINNVCIPWTDQDLHTDNSVIESGIVTIVDDFDSTATATLSGWFQTIYDNLPQ
jgi:hypothetical protein